MIIGNREFNTTEHTYIIGILNVTPDSFSDGGKYSNIDQALLRTETMISEGTDILDIGGESTKPGYTQISNEEEIERVAPVIEAVKSRFDIPISLDTYKYEVAKEGIRCGADLINDIWGLQKDERMADLIAETKVACCLMHNRENAIYDNFTEDLFTDMGYILSYAMNHKISEDKIILDPGIGFAKSTQQNLATLANMEKLSLLGVPWLLGASRKSVIGNTLELPVEERLEGTLATTVIAVMKGASFVRVHDIKENKRVIAMTEAVRDCQ